MAKCKHRVPTEDFELAGTILELLSVGWAIPASFAQFALATATVTICGRHRYPKTGTSREHHLSETVKAITGQGRLFHAEMNSQGHFPTEGFRKSGPNARKVVTDNCAGLKSLLACFGFTLDDVLERYGNPGEDETKTWKLVDLVDSMRFGKRDQEGHDAAAA